MRNLRVPVRCLALAALLFCAPVSARVPPIPHPDIVLDIGHGGIDGGTSFGTILEKEINLGVGMKLYPVLRKKGIAVSINRTQDYALSDDNKWLRAGRHKRDLAQRVEITNRLNPVFMLSLHVNWSSNRSKGPLVIYQKQNETSKKLAVLLQRELNGLYGTSTLPEPGRSYYLLRHSQVPAVIIEMGYMSNGRDRELLTSPEFQRKLGEAIGAACGQALRDASADR